MRSFSGKNYYQIGLSLTALSVTAVIHAGSAQAATFTVGGYTWDSANSVVSGSIVSGEKISGFDASFRESQTVGSILGFGSNTSVDLGDSTNRGMIELNWGQGKSLVNADGKDFVVYENGSGGSPEAFAVAVRKVGQNTFSQFLYQFSSGFEPNVFATGFDLSDFGIGEKEEIDAIRVMNLIATDKVSGADGQGFVGGNFSPLTGPFGIGSYTSDKFDADITYVVGLHSPKPVPEPSSILGLLALGAIGVTSRLLRRT
ncbi:PEP-CTERM sorting domain-containing protein [Aerosakkonemataceae cyanobacterium BLCC-F50]|uniref:PEP-CTERM sorting domain-containing protein n=1 Tax=Floridaenema flaviceps BLCC-F50 TaxID=3153642 RepID=A0ABV4XR55_9CYAN